MKKLAAVGGMLLLASFSAAAQWKYTSWKDEMTDRPIKLASVLSKNSVNFSFPYHGGTRMRLAVRRRPAGDVNIFVDVARGQFVCDEPCPVMVRFDDGEPVRMLATLADDGSHDTLFFNEEDELLASLRVAKRVRIKATFYQEGDRVFEFATPGLKFVDEASAK